MRWIHLTLVMVALAVGTCSLAQSDTLATGFLNGIVTDQKTKETMPFAAVRIVELKLGAITTEDGYYAFKEIPPGRYTIAVDWVGYEPYVKEKVKVRAGEIAHLDIALQFRPKEVFYPPPCRGK